MSLKSPVTPPGIDPGTVRLVAQRLNHYVTPGTTLWLLVIRNIKVQFTLLQTMMAQRGH
jgi:hypothetical protein